MIDLRPYQHGLIERARGAMARGSRRVLLTSPTGSGKTCMVAQMLSAAVARGKRAWFCVHRNELLDQSVRTFVEAADLRTGIIAAGYPSTPQAPVQVCSVPSLTRRADKLQAPDLIVFDEAHHQASKTWSDIAKRFPRAAHIGLTATPERLDGKGLAPYFDTLIQGPTTADLIDAGYLSHYALYTPPVQIDTSGLRMKAGDFDRHEVDARMTASTVVGDAVSHYVQHCTGGRALVFAWNLVASRQLADDFSAHGVPAAHVDGETPRPERADAMKRFRDGRLRVLCNVDLFGEGLDVPAVDAIFLLRPTSSLGLYLQQVGRGLRPAPGKTLVKIFDHVNNWQRHGLPDDVREWKLDGREKRSRNSEAMGRRCDKCFGVSPIGSTACKYCGQPFPVQAREITQVDGSLVEMNPEELRALRANQRDFYQHCKTLEEWKALAKQLGYHSGWSLHMMVRQYQQQRENPTLFSSDEATS